MTDHELMDASCTHGLPWYECDQCIPPGIEIPPPSSVSGQLAICTACANLRGVNSMTLTRTCDAFPTGIPEEISLGFDHRQPFEGDNGIRFELAEGDEATSWLAAYDEDQAIWQ